MRRPFILFGALLAASPVIAQEVYVPPSISDNADLLLQGRLRDRMIRQAQERRHGRPATAATRSRATPAQVAACAGRARFRAQYGAADPRMRRLDGLCRGVGL